MKVVFSVFLFLAALISCYGQNSTDMERVSDRYVNNNASTYKKALNGFVIGDISELDNPKELYNYYFNYAFSNYGNHSEAVLEILSAIVDRVYVLSPNSFEYNYLKYQYMGDSQYLLKAYLIEPNETDIWDQMLEYYEINGKISEAKSLALKIKNSDKYNADIYNYQRNVIAGCKQNGVIVTQGELDTYPLLVLLYTESPNQNIRVINFTLLKHTAYRTRMLSNPNISISNPSSLLQAMVNSSSNTNFYVSLMMKTQSLMTMKDNLYLTGLLFQYTLTPINNVDINQDLFLNKYNLDYLSNKSWKDYETKGLNKNYIPMLKMLEAQSADINEELRIKINNLINLL